MKRLALLTGVILLTLTMVLVVWQLRDVILMFLLALAIAAALSDPVDVLHSRAWPRALAILVVYVVVFGSLILLVVAITVPLLNELDPLAQAFLIQYTELQTRLLALSGQRPLYIPHLPTTEQMAALLATSEGSALAQNAMLWMQNIGNVLGQFALAIVVAVYWSADQARFERLWLSLLAPERRTRARSLWNTLQKEVGSYLRSEIIQSVLAGSLLALGFWLIGVEFPLFLALVVALAWFVPLFGGAVAVLCAGLVGWLTSPWVAAAAMVLTLAVLLLMEFWVERRLYTHDRYWGVLIVLVMLAMGDALGVVGLLVAPPLAVGIQITLNLLLERPQAPEEEPVVTDLEELRSRVAELQQRVQQNGEEASPRLVNLVQRLETLLTEAEESAR